MALGFVVVGWIQGREIKILQDVDRSPLAVTPLFLIRTIGDSVDGAAKSVEGVTVLLDSILSLAFFVR